MYWKMNKNRNVNFKTIFKLNHAGFTTRNIAYSENINNHDKMS